MKNKPQIFHKAFAITMLAVFAMVYILSFVCVSGLKTGISVNSNEYVHSDDHHAGRQGENHQSHNHENSGDEQKDDNCCSELTAAYFTSAQKNSDIQFNLNKNSITYYTFNVSDKVPHNKISYSLRHFSSQLLKRKIPDIRILIQSFLI